MRRASPAERPELPPAMRPSVRAYIGLGANLGDALGALRAAAARIAQQGDGGSALASSIWRSAPVEASGPDFLNAVIGIDTRLEPLALLQALHAIEAAHGRARPFRNAPRTLDLDVLLYGEQALHLPGLDIPHPRMHLRRFVLAPLCEIAPDAKVPGQGGVRDLLAAVAQQDCTPTEHALLLTTTI